MKIAGIYIDKTWTTEEIANNEVTEFGLHLGKNQVAFFANGYDIYDLHDCVEFGAHDLIELPQCTFGISKPKKEWHIKDNSKFGDAKIIAKGKYLDNKVETQVREFLRNMTGF
jgi:hypothetical protein